MSDLRERLEREGQRVSLPADAADRMFERGRRRARTRRAGALALGAALLLVVIMIVRSGLPSGDRAPQPATPTPTTPRDIAGTYSALLPAGDPDVARLDMNGTYTLHLGADGTMGISSPRAVNLPGTTFTFELERGRMITDALVGTGCDERGIYRVALQAGSLALSPVTDTCDVRATLLATSDWSTTGTEATADALEGDWLATFSCEQMRRAVERAPVPSETQAFWSEAVGAELGSDDPSDPCSGVTQRLSYTFRFDEGRLLIFDARLVEGFDGAYELRGDSFIMRDATTDNIPGRYRAAFRMRGDALQVDLIGRAGRDPFFVGTWESAPLIRTSS